MSVKLIKFRGNGNPDKYLSSSSKVFFPMLLRLLLGGDGVLDGGGFQRTRTALTNTFPLIVIRFIICNLSWRDGTRNVEIGLNPNIYFIIFIHHHSFFSPFFSSYLCLLHSSAAGVPTLYPPSMPYQPFYQYYSVPMVSFVCNCDDVMMWSE